MSPASPRVLVTGSSGFVGRHLCRELSKLPAVLLCATRKAEPSHPRLPGPRTHWQLDLSDGRRVREMMAEAQPDVVFHLAGNPLVRQDHDDPSGVTRDNVVATHNLLANCPEGCRFVLASSATVYGDGPPGAWSESTPLAPNSPYGASKVAAESLVSAYSRLGRVRGLSLRLAANVGAFATHGVVSDVCRKLLARGDSLELIGERPGSSKPYVHVADTVRAFLLFGISSSLQGALNVSTEGSLSIEDLAFVLMEALGIEKTMVWRGAGSVWAGDNKRVEVTSLAAREMGWRPECAMPHEAVRKGAMEMVRYWRSYDA